MKKYVGLPCEICHENFQEKDDIVVCPVCGAPFHRSCYKKNNVCEFESQHKNGFVWLPPNDPTISKDEQITCASCGATNRKDQLFCQMCSAKLEQQNKTVILKNPYTSSEAGEQKLDQADEWNIAGLSARDISAYIGHNSYYFLHKFQNLLTKPLQASWNWSAFLFSYLYFFYRKIYVVGLGILALFLALSVPEVIYTMERIKMLAPEYFQIVIPYNKELMDSMFQIMSKFRFFKIAISLSCGLFANKLILKKALTDIITTKKIFGDRVGTREYYTSLFFQGKPNKAAVFMVIGMFAIGYFALVSWLVTILGPYLPL